LKTYITGALTIVPVSKKELFRKLGDKIEFPDINQKVRKVSWISNMAKQKNLNCELVRNNCKKSTKATIIAKKKNFAAGSHDWPSSVHNK
jgi:hypothetical protein